MNTSTDIPSLNSLEYIPYLTEEGIIKPEFDQKIAVYGIFDQNKILQYVGYTRNLYLSLKQHLIRQPNQCYWLKLQIIDRPNRTLLDNIRQSWIDEDGNYAENEENEAKWTQAIDIKPYLTEEENEEYNKSEEMKQIKLLKKVARRVEEDIKIQLQQRNIQEEIRFNPKLKEKGLLDLK